MQIDVASNCHDNLPALASLLTEVERLKEKRRKISKIYLSGIFDIFLYAKEVYELLNSLDYIIPRELPLPTQGASCFTERTCPAILDKNHLE